MDRETCVFQLGQVDITAHGTTLSMNSLPKLLFLAWHFPPLSTIACVRTWNLAKYLSRSGWRVTVVTPDPSGWRRVEKADEVAADLEREDIQCIYTDHSWRFLSAGHLSCRNTGIYRFAGGLGRKVLLPLGVDEGVGWLRAAEDACARLSASDVDVILATGGPFTSFALAEQLSRRLARPYVLDYRDLWTANPHAKRQALWATAWAEQRALRGCAAVTSVSWSLASALAGRFSVGRKLHVVTNGYDPEEMRKVAGHAYDHFAIVYAGDLYPPKRTLTPLLLALRRLKTKEPPSVRRWCFHYYGGTGEQIRPIAEQFGLQNEVVLHGRVPRAQALAAVAGAGTAVVVTCITKQGSLEDRSIVTGKLFEALGLGTRTLLIAPQGSDAGAILDTSNLGRRFSGDDVEGIASFLSEAIRTNTPDRSYPEAYSWPNIVKAMDLVLRSAVEDGPRRQSETAEEQCSWLTESFTGVTGRTSPTRFDHMCLDAR